MFDDFTPATDMERVFAQAAGWEIDRVWKEADRSGDQQDWIRFFGLTFCLAYHFAIDGEVRHLNTVTIAMIEGLEELTASQLQSPFKIGIYVVKKLLDDNLCLDSTEIRLVMRVLLCLVKMPGWGHSELVEIASGLKTIFGRTLRPDEIEKLAEQCRQMATETGRMFSDEHALLRWSVTKYSGA